MATSFSGSLKLSVSGTLVKDIDLGTLTYNLPYGYSKTITNGTGADNANMFWTDTRTLTASSSESLDLAGSIANAFGDTMTFTKLKGLIIEAASGNTNNVVVGGAASNAWATWVGNANDVVNVRPGGVLFLYAPDSTSYAVTASTGDILQIANSSSGSSVTYNIVLIGTV